MILKGAQRGGARQLASRINPEEMKAIIVSKNLHHSTKGRYFVRQ